MGGKRPANEYVFVLYTEEERYRKKEVIVLFSSYSAKRLYATCAKSVRRKVPPFLASVVRLTGVASYISSK